MTNQDSTEHVSRLLNDQEETALDYMTNEAQRNGFRPIKRVAAADCNAVTRNNEAR